MFIDDSSPPADASGSKSHFAPLGSAQQASWNRFSPGGNRVAPLDRNNNDGLIHAGSAYYGCALRPHACMRTGVLDVRWSNLLSFDVAPLAGAPAARNSADV